ncbi:MAG TPA: alpha/beta hydrolase [Anaerolineaceae bacterium]|nr:alpha/beta hydrolase [Anaerolineaceae bacterium]
MEPIERSWKTKDGLNIYAKEFRPEGDARAVVCLVPGLGEHCNRYLHVARAFNDAGFALLTFDPRGHGRSEGQRGHAPTYDHLMDDIDLLLENAEKLYPGKDRFLYGHSLGGNLVLNYAIRRQPKLAGVISTSPGLLQAVEPPAWKTSIGKVMYNIWPTMSLANGLDREGLSRDHAVIDKYSSDPLVHDRISARMGLDVISSGKWAIEHADEMRLPLLLVHGSADRITSCNGSDAFAAKVKGDVTFKLWEGGYHELHNEPDQAQVIQTLVDWVAARVHDTHVQTAAD